MSVWGPDAARILDSLFANAQGRKVAQAPPGALLYGLLQEDGDLLDEVIICRRVLPDLFEVNCHGGIVPLMRVLAALKRRGVREVGAGAGVASSGWAAERLDAIRREAAEALPFAMTPLVTKMLLDQLSGALSSGLQEILVDLRGGDAASATERIRLLLQTAVLGIRLCNPARLVVAGKPNVGKSTLVNRLLAEERVLVHHRPGTTRDPVEQAVSIRGYPFVLVDTAGIAQEDDELGRLAAERSQGEIERGDIVLLLFDRSQSCGTDDEKVVRALPQGRVIPVLNKCDLPATGVGFPATGGLDGADPPCGARFATHPVVISALCGTGVDGLESLLVSFAFPLRWRPGMAVVFTARQKRRLESALTAMGEVSQKPSESPRRHPASGGGARFAEAAEGIEACLCGGSGGSGCT